MRVLGRRAQVLPAQDTGSGVEAPFGKGLGEVCIDGDMWAAFALDAVCIIVAAALVTTTAVGITDPIRLGVAISFALFVPGWAVLRSWQSGSLSEKMVLSLGLSIGVVTVATSAFLWLRLWHPLAILDVMAAATSARCAVSLVTVKLGSLRFRSKRSWRSVVEAPGNLMRLGEASDVLMVVAWVLWVVAMQSTKMAGGQGSWGLVGALPSSFYAAFVAILAAAVCILLLEKVSVVRCALLMGSLIGMLQLPIAILFSGPRYFWDFSTIGDIQYVNLHGALDASLSIYQRWPGFAASVAWFDDLAGLKSPDSYVSWFPVAIDSLVVIAFSYAVGGLPLSRREKMIAIVLFYLGEWVLTTSGQDIVTPQAPAFVLALIAFGIVFRWFVTWPDARMQVPKTLVARLSQSFHALRLHWRRSGRSREGEARFETAPLLILAGVYAPIVLMHPLTPYAVLLQLGVALFVNRIRPVWLVPVLGVIALAYLLPNLNYLTATEPGIASVGHVAQNAALPTSPGRSLGPDRIALPLINIVFYALGGIGVLRRWRAGKDVRVLAALAGAPAVIIVLIHYGTDTTYRSIMYSLPWVACLGACAFGINDDGAKAEAKHARQTRGDLRARATVVWRRTVPLQVLVALVIISGCLILVNYSQTELYEVAPGDVAAANWLYDQSKPGIAVYVNTFFPINGAARYNLFLTQKDLEAYITGFAYFGGTVKEIGNYVCGFEWGDEDRAYIVLSAAQQKSAVLLGLAPPGFIVRLERELGAARSGWTQVFTRSGTIIYEGGTSCTAQVRGSER